MGVDQAAEDGRLTLRPEVHMHDYSLISGAHMNPVLLNYYEAIERASQDMLEAARAGNWDHVVKLEGACALLISQLKHAASKQSLGPEEAQLKSRIMQRILINDAEIRQLAEPWLEDLDNMLAGRPKTLH
jgi:flagellar protein FliT